MKTDMLINSLSPVLEDMLVHEHSNDIVHLEISDATMLKEYFTEKVVHSLLRKEHMLIIAPDRMDSSIPSKILTKNNLAHYSMLYTSVQDPRPILSNRMNMLSRLKEIPLLRQEYNHSVLKYKELNHKIHDTLLSITKRNIKNPSFKEMLLSIKPRPKATISESVIEAITNININPTILKKIRQFQKLFQKRFVYMDDCGMITDACIEDDESLGFAKKDIATLQKDIQQTTINIEHELYLMKRVIAYEVEEEVAQWLKIKETLQNLFLESELNKYPTSFVENAMPLIAQFAGFKYLKLNLNIIPEMGWGQVSKILDIVSAVMSGAGDSIDIYFEDYIRKLSPFNTNNELLDKYINKGVSILKTINNSKYINYSCSHKFLQVDALLAELKQSKLKLALCHRTLVDKAYLKFVKTRQELGIIETVMQSLYYLENDDWGDIIEFYGHRSHLTLNFNSNMNRLDDWYEDLKNAHQLVKHTTNKEVHNRWCNLRNQALSTIRNNNWAIYKEIFEGNECSHSVRKLIDEIGSGLQDFFPIMVVKESELKYILSEPSLKFDVAFYMDPKDVSITDVSVLHEKKINITIASTHTLDINDIIANYSVVSNYSSDVRVLQSLVLCELDKTERYKYAVAIASSLNSIIRPANIYKVGEKVIITLVDPLLDKRVSSALEISTNNVLFTATTEIPDLVETLIHHDQICLVIENNLLNDQNGMSALWQRSIIEQLSEAGISICNVYTHELYQNISIAVEKLVDQINVQNKELLAPEMALTI